MVHSLVLATFASIIAPFGGFFASGFKRAFGIKVLWGHCMLSGVVGSLHAIWSCGVIARTLELWGHCTLSGVVGSLHAIWSCGVIARSLELCATSMHSSSDCGCCAICG